MMIRFHDLESLYELQMKKLIKVSQMNDTNYYIIICYRYNSGRLPIISRRYVNAFKQPLMMHKQIHLKLPFLVLTNQAL